MTWLLLETEFEGDCEHRLFAVTNSTPDETNTYFHTIGDRLVLFIRNAHHISNKT